MFLKSCRSVRRGRHLEHPLQHIVTGRRIAGAIVARTLNRDFGQDPNTSQPHGFIDVVILRMSHTLRNAQGASGTVLRILRGVKHRAISSWRSHPVGGGPTTPESVSGAWSKGRSGSIRGGLCASCTGKPVPESCIPYSQRALCKAQYW